MVPEWNFSLLVLLIPTIAKMIYDDRERLRQHVDNVSELQRIARALEAKFLAQEERERRG